MKRTFPLVTLMMLLLLPVVGWATTYTVGSSGCDYTSIQAAFNNEDLGPGDIIEVRADTPGGTKIYSRAVWGSNDSGSLENPVILRGREGDTIIISCVDSIEGWNESSNWTDNGNNVWYMTYSHTPGRLLIDDQEVIKAESSNTVNSTYKWYYDTSNTLLYVYSEGNPAIVYSSIKGSTYNYSLYVEHVNNIIIENLTFEGGYHGCILFRDANYVTIRSCTIGKYATVGILVACNESTYDPSTHIKIYNDKIESGFRGFYDHESIGIGDGIKFFRGVTDSIVSNCLISNWGHNCIELTSAAAYHGVYNNIIADNIFSGENVSYCRAVGLGGPDGKCYNNVITRNIMRNFTVRNQINGDHNKVTYNLIVNMTNSPCKTYGTAQGIDLQGFSPYVCHDNIITNNIIVNCEEAGIRLSSNVNNKENNTITNNIIYNCGTNSKNGLDGYGIVVDNASDILNNTFQNNLVYNPEVTNVIYYRGTAMTGSTWNDSDSNGDTIEENIQSDPLLTSNYHLSPNSPCINAGTFISGFHETAKDRDGQPILGTPDIGCDERKALWWDGRRWHMQRMY